MKLVVSVLNGIFMADRSRIKRNSAMIISKRTKVEVLTQRV